MNVSAWAIKRPIPVILLFLVLTLMGLMAYRGLGVDDDPDVDFPVVVIGVGQPGAAPMELETQVTRKIEDGLVGIANLDHIQSTVTEGSSTTVAEFKVGTNSERALNDVRDAVSKLRQTLPNDIREPSILHPTGAGEPFITYSIASPKRSVAELSYMVDHDISRALLGVNGVSQVDREGGVKREVRISLDPARLRALNTSVDAVGVQLKALNVNVPGGRAETGGQEQSIRTLGSATSIDELRATRIALGNGNFARLGELGTVEDSVQEVRSKAFLNGKPAVAFSVVRSKGSPQVQTEEATVKAVEELKKSLPADVELTLVRTMADYTRQTFRSTMEALVVGAVLAVLVIWLFLRNWQSTFISALAIPLSVIATFACMKALHFTLNGLTMLALTLVVGILVDDAIVDLENIYRHIGLGKSPFKAALEATDEIGLAIVATTFTIVAVFLPVAFMSGITGQFFRSFGITVAIAVLFSLLVARTLTPMMAAYMLPARAEADVHQDEDAAWRRTYMRILEWALNHRWLTMAFAVVMFVASCAMVPFIPTGFIENGDIGQARVDVTLPPGSKLEDTERATMAAASLVQGRPEVKTVFINVGGSDVAKAHLNIMLKPRKERSVSLADFEAAVRPAFVKIPGARVELHHFGVGGAKPVNILLSGTDADALKRVGEQLITQMRGLPDLRDVTSSAAELRPEVEIVPDFARAAEQGVSVLAIGRAARLGTQGDVDFNLPKFNAGDQQVDIRVQLTEAARGDLAAMGDLLVMGRNGLVPLRTVAEVKMGTGPVQIDRFDRARQVTFTANLSPEGNLGDALKKVKALPVMRNLPPGVSQGTRGESNIMDEVFTQFAIALVTAVLFIYAVLVLLFGGFLQPLTIMMALPLSFGGALIGLMLAHKMLGLMALIGIVMLMGLVTNNSILLVEYTIMARHQGVPRREALLAAGRDRLRPILMTTIAMIAGMLPMALALGEGTEGLSPMAVAVIGGLVTSTVFTLVVIPAAYTFIDDFQGLLLRATARFRRGSIEATVPAASVANEVLKP
jgi:multidrug efflux pump subunit AcrB